MTWRGFNHHGKPVEFSEGEISAQQKLGKLPKGGHVIASPGRFFLARNPEAAQRAGRSDVAAMFGAAKLRARDVPPKAL